MKIIKITVGIVFLLILILIALSFIVPKFIDINKYKTNIEQQIFEATGRKIHINENIKLSILPKISVETGMISIDNPADFNHDNNTFASIDRTSIGLKLLPLIKKKVEIDTISIEGLRVNLVQNENQQVNWEFSSNDTNQNDTSTEESSPPITENEFIKNLSIEKVQIINSALSFKNKETNMHHNVKDISLNLNNFAFNQISSLDFSMHWEDLSSSEKINFAILKLNSNIRFNLESNNLDLEDTKIDGNFNDMTFQQSIAKTNVDLNVNVFTLGNLVSQITIANSPANLMLSKVQINNDKQLISIRDISGDYKDQNNEATFSTEAIDFAIDKNKLIFNPLQLRAVLNINAEEKKQNIEISIPKQSLLLDEAIIKLIDIHGSFNNKQLSTPATIHFSDIVLNQNTQTFKIDGINLALEDLATIDTNIQGTISPLLANVDIKIDISNLQTLLSRFGVQANVINPDALGKFNFHGLAQYNQDKNTLAMKNFDGEIGYTHFTGVTLLSLANEQQAAAYQLKLNLDNVNIDHWIADADANSSTTNNEVKPDKIASQPLSSSEQSAASMSLKDSLLPIALDLVIDTQQIKSDNNEFSANNFNLSVQKEHNHGIAIKTTSAINHASLPEKIDLNIASLLDIGENQINLNQSIIEANGKSSEYKLNIPNISVNPSNPVVNINNINAFFKQASQKADLILSNLSFEPNSQTLTLKGIQVDALLDKNQIKASLPFSQFKMGQKHLISNDITMDLFSEKPIGRISAPVLDFNLDKQSFGKTSITYSGTDGQIDFQLQNSSVDNIVGSIVTKQFNLKGLLTRFDSYPLEANSSALTNITLNLPIEFKNSALSINQLNSTIDESTLSGSVFVDLKTHGSYKANLNLNQLDLRKYISNSATSKNTTNSKQSEDAAAIPYEQIKGLNLDAKISIGSLTSPKGAVFSNSIIEIKAKDNTLNISPLKSEFANGIIDSSLTVDANQENIEVKSTFDQVNLGVALSSLGVTEKFTGNGNLAFSSTAKGKDIDQILRSLNGTLHMDIANGDLKGIDVQKILLAGFRSLNSLQHKEIKSKYEPKDGTGFSSMVGDWKIDNGVLHGSNLSLKAPAFNINGEGNVNLPKNNIDYVFNVAVIKSFEGQGRMNDQVKGRTIPIKISGDLSQPSYSLDLSSLFQNEIQNQFKQQTDKLQNKLLDKLDKKLGIDNSSNSQESNTNNNAPPQEEKSLEEEIKEKAKDQIQKKIFDLFN